MTLPLPLAPFEHYMLTDHRPAYPMEFFLRLRFTGCFDHATLDAALSAALPRHPLLAARVQRHGRRWFWEPAASEPTIDWRNESPAEALPHCDPLDVRSGPGLRVIALQASGRTDLTIQVHHTCSDGLGMLRFLDDVLICYAQHRGILPPSALPPLDLESLRDRGKLAVAAGAGPGALLGQVVALAGIYRFLLRRCEPLAGAFWGTDDDRCPADYPASLTRRLEASETAALLDAARTQGVTVNDLLIREFFLASAGHYRSRSSDRERARFRACVPVNLRPADTGPGSAANVVSYVFLDRYLKETRHPQRLLHSICGEMRRIKRWRLGLTFALSLALCHRVPGMVAWMCRRRHCRATGLITNLGTVFARSPLADERGRLALGETVLEEVEVFGTWRPLTAVAIAALSYAGRLALTLHYDPRVISADEATEFIDQFTAGLRRSIV